MFCFCFMKTYLQVRIENHWTVPLDHHISYPPKNIFLFTQCRRLLEKFCATNSVYQTRKEKEKKNTKCLSYGCRMESPRWMWDVLVGEDVSLTLRKHKESVFAKSGESWIYTDLLPTQPQWRNSLWSRTISYCLSRLLFINILTPVAFFPWKLLQVAAAFLCVQR